MHRNAIKQPLLCKEYLLCNFLINTAIRKAILLVLQYYCTFRFEWMYCKTVSSSYHCQSPVIQQPISKAINNSLRYINIWHLCLRFILSKKDNIPLKRLSWLCWPHVGNFYWILSYTFSFLSLFVEKQIVHFGSSSQVLLVPPGGKSLRASSKVIKVLLQ